MSGCAAVLIVCYDSLCKQIQELCLQSTQPALKRKLDLASCFDFLQIALLEMHTSRAAMQDTVRLAQLSQPIGPNEAALSAQLYHPRIRRLSLIEAT